MKEIIKNKKLLIIAAAVLVLAAAWYFLMYRPGKRDEQETVEADQESGGQSGSDPPPPAAGRQPTGVRTRTGPVPRPVNLAASQAQGSGQTPIPTGPTGEAALTGKTKLKIDLTAGRMAGSHPEVWADGTPDPLGLMPKWTPGDSEAKVRWFREWLTNRVMSGEPITQIMAGG